MKDNNAKMITRGVDPSDNITKFPKKANSRLKDPRIVCVPRAFGTKDRHSKVVTLKGLRDRRVRLSVPTALQLYDLQDKLGLDQPSKVVEWLLKEAKHEIDKLPQLQIPPIREAGLPLTELLKLNHRPTNALSSTLRKDEETMVVVSDEYGVKLNARNLDLINHLKGTSNSNSNRNSFTFAPSYQNDFLSRPGIFNINNVYYIQSHLYTTTF